MPLKHSGSEGGRHWSQWDVVTPHGNWNVIVQNTGPMWFMYLNHDVEEGMIRTVGCYPERAAAESYASNIADCLEAALMGGDEHGHRDEASTPG